MDQSPGGDFSVKSTMNEMTSAICPQLSSICVRSESLMTNTDCLDVRLIFNTFFFWAIFRHLPRLK